MSDVITPPEEELEELRDEDRFSNSLVTGRFLRPHEDGYIFGFGPDHGLEAFLRGDEFRDPPQESFEAEILVQRPWGKFWAGSMRMAQKLAIWRWLEEAAEAGEVVEGEVIRANKGGLSVDIGLRAFCPKSQIDARRVDDPRIFVGRREMFKITKFDTAKGEIILSRRQVVEARQDEERARILDELEPGKIYEGTVSKVVRYGAFVDIGGRVEGLLHESNMSWGRLDSISEYIAAGDRLKVVVLDWDPAKGRLGLGRKQLEQDPWEGIAQRVREGDVVEGRVVSLADFGAFVDIGSGLEGLVHVSEISWTQRVQHPSELLERGQQVKVKIISLDAEQRRLGLSIKNLERNPWEIVAEELSPGARLRGEVRNITDYGLFVEIVPGIEGLVHVSEISWSSTEERPQDAYQVGQEVEVVVLGIDPSEERASLGIKQLEDDPWGKAAEVAKKGAKVHGVISRIEPFGAFVQIVEGVEGLIHISELAEDRVNNVTDVVRMGQEIEALVLNFERDKRRISLSLWRDELDDGVPLTFDESDAATSTLGDILRAALGEEEE